MGHRITWDEEGRRIIDRAYVGARVHELQNMEELHILGGKFDSIETFRSVLVPSLENFETSALEVGPIYQWPDEAKTVATTNEALAALGDLPNLRGLGLEWCRLIDDRGAAHIGRLRGLTDLFLESGMTDVGLASLGGLECLRNAQLECSFEFTGAGFEAWDRAPHLEVLSVGVCTSLEDSALRHIARFENLRDLRLYGCTELTPAGLLALGPLKKLEALWFGGLDVDIRLLGELRDLFPMAEFYFDADMLPEADRKAGWRLGNPKSRRPAS